MPRRRGFGREIAKIAEAKRAEAPSHGKANTSEKHVVHTRPVSRFCLKNETPEM